MKKKLLFLASCIAMLAIFVSVRGQNLVAGGNMESDTGWDTVSVSAATHPIEFVWGYTVMFPTAGSGGCLYFSSFAGAGDGVFNNDFILFHPVTVTPGKTYKVTGAVRDISNNLTNFWTEIGISSNNPKDSIKVGATYLMAMNTWDGCGVGIDGTFEENSCKYNVNDAPNPYYHVSDELEGEQTFYVVIEMGTWNDAAEERGYEFLIDEISVVDSASGTAVFDYTFDNGAELTHYPNPASQVSNISYYLPTSGNAVLNVYNMLGEKVETLVNEFKVAGHYTVPFDVSHLPANMYYYRLEFDGHYCTDKVLIVK
ncbi:MAG: T9SS type A sorting domain-containing protein [Bacteroidales bacterium]|nr:T9SS type A sorting domain-containing protein [Bacteroidales bacterium]